MESLRSRDMDMDMAYPVLPLARPPLTLGELVLTKSMRHVRLPHVAA